MQETLSHSLLVYNTPDVKIRLEYTDRLAIAHIYDLVRYTPKIRKEMDTTLRGLTKFLKFKGYAGLHAGIPRNLDKTKKLVMLMGFTYIGYSQGLDLYFYEGE